MRAVHSCSAAVGWSWGTVGHRDHEQQVIIPHPDYDEWDDPNLDPDVISLGAYQLAQYICRHVFRALPSRRRLTVPGGPFCRRQHRRPGHASWHVPGMDNRAAMVHYPPRYESVFLLPISICRGHWCTCFVSLFFALMFSLVVYRSRRNYYPTPSVGYWPMPFPSTRFSAFPLIRARSR